MSDIWQVDMLDRRSWLLIYYPYRNQICNREWKWFFLRDDSRGYSKRGTRNTEEKTLNTAFTPWFLASSDTKFNRHTWIPMGILSPRLWDACITGFRLGKGTEKAHELNANSCCIIICIITQCDVFHIPNMTEELEDREVGQILQE